MPQITIGLASWFRVLQHRRGPQRLPAARVATVNGQLITTDEHGRYHITCAAVPDGQIGSNFVLKLDTRTIPEGYTPTSDNPQSIRLTRGKISELNFGIQKARVVHIDLDQRAFVAGSSDLQPAFAQRLPGLNLPPCGRDLTPRNADLCLPPASPPSGTGRGSRFRAFAIRLTCSVL